MRLKQDKVHDLAHKIVDMLREHPEIHLESGEDALRIAIGSVILDDLEEEADIDREVDALLAQHSRQMQQADMDPHEMRTKFKRQIAKQRGFTL